MNIRLVQFLNGGAFDLHGRMFDEIIEWDEYRLEHVHDYIQWVFPLTHRSMYNTTSPLLDYESIEMIQRSQSAMLNIDAMSAKMLDFYGFWLWGDEVMDLWWVTPNNHNFLRITRILKCLNLFELHDKVDQWFAELTKAYDAYPDIIGPETFGYWTDAVDRK